MNDYLRLWKHMAWESGHVDRAVAQQWNILQKLDLQQQILMTGHQIKKNDMAMHVALMRARCI